MFFNKLERFLAELNADDAPDFDTDKFQKVIEYTFQRINTLLESIDDSTEQRQGCLKHLHQLYVKLLKQNQCRDETQSKRFFSFWLDDRYDLLGIQADSWLSAKAQEKFKQLAHSEWKNNSSDNSSNDSSKRQTTLKTWQKVKLARYLFEEAIQSHDNLRANEYRRFFSKD